ncbi:hypothetical protein BaRGS_00000698 [Batillaria attramentaria]|uniref:Peroxiredoxin-like 2A n=1 Tax=Batillaria attramentaria TaxID=370345 RepID=A0ABD0M897_9CAEN
MGGPTLLKVLGGVAVGVAVLCNLPSNPFIPRPKPATLSYLAETELQTIGSTPRKFKASELWENTGAVIMVVRRPGCALCREEAVELARLRPELQLRNIPLYGVVHETLGVPEFAPYLKGDGIFLDSERRFYGPQERWMFISGFLRASVWSNIVRNWKKEIDGNLDGEGRLLGGVFVMGPGKQGILYEYREKEFGDQANITDIVNAIRKIAPAASNKS